MILIFAYKYTSFSIFQNIEKDVEEKNDSQTGDSFPNWWKKSILFIKENDFLIARDSYVIILP